MRRRPRAAGLQSGTFGRRCASSAAPGSARTCVVGQGAGGGSLSVSWPRQAVQNGLAHAAPAQPAAHAQQALRVCAAGVPAVVAEAQRQGGGEPFCWRCRAAGRGGERPLCSAIATAAAWPAADAFSQKLGNDLIHDRRVLGAQACRQALLQRGGKLGAGMGTGLRQATEQQAGLSVLSRPGRREVASTTRRSTTSHLRTSSAVGGQAVRSGGGGGPASAGACMALAALGGIARPWTGRWPSEPGWRLAGTLLATSRRVLLGPPESGL